MPRVTTAAMADSGAAILLGTSGGDVLECVLGASPQLRRIGGFEGVAVRSLTSAPDGALVIASNALGSVGIWRRGEAEPVDSWASDQAVIQSATLGPREYLTLDWQRRGLIWAPGADGALEPAIMMRAPGQPCAFDRFAVWPGGERVTLISGFDWMVWDRRQNALIAEQQPVDGLQLVYLAGQVGVSANGRFYFVYWDDYIGIDTTTGKELWIEPVDFSPTGAAMSDDAQTLLLGDRNGRLIAVGPDSAAKMELKSGEFAIQQISLTADGRVGVFVNSRGAAGVIDVPSGRVVLDPEDLDRMLDRL